MEKGEASRRNLHVNVDNLSPTVSPIMRENQLDALLKIIEKLTVSTEEIKEQLSVVIEENKKLRAEVSSFYEVCKKQRFLSVCCFLCLGSSCK